MDGKLSNINENTILLLGANGQLGSLIQENAPAHITLLALTSADLDIANREEMKKIISETRPALIINAAAYTQVDKAEEEIDKAFAVNALGPENIALASDEDTKVIHISTDFVFDGKGKTPYESNDATNPIGVYGESKLAGEAALLKVKPKAVTIIRTAWLYSAAGKNFVNTMLFLMANKDELSVVADQRGTPTSAHTLAKVIWKFAGQNEANGTYHWTDKGEASWYEFACAIQEIALDLGLLKKAIKITPVTTEQYPTPATRPSYSVLAKEETYRALGFEGKHWKDELKDTLLQIKALT